MAGKCARGLFGPNRVQIIDHKDLIFRIFAGLFFGKKYAEGPFGVFPSPLSLLLPEVSGDGDGSNGDVGDAVLDGGESEQPLRHRSEDRLERTLQKHPRKTSRQADDNLKFN